MPEKKIQEPQLFKKNQMCLEELINKKMPKEAKFHDLIHTLVSRISVQAQISVQGGILPKKPNKRTHPVRRTGWNID